MFNPKTLFSLVVLAIWIKLSESKECPKDQVLLNHECKNLVNFHNKCLSSNMCRTKNAICLDENNREHNFNADSLDIEREAYCQCPFRYQFNLYKDECVFFRKLCSHNSTCEKNYFCDVNQCRCLFEDNPEKYYSHCLHQEINVITCFKDPIKTTCTNSTQRYELSEPFLINQTWSTMMWKLSFLFVFLILFLLLVKGVLRARQNEDYLNWAHTIALHQEALRNENLSNVNRSNRDISINIPIDQPPPSYTDAIKMNTHHTERQNQTSI